uniref:Uncharacterized protein n=1 Tax=Opuntia streptacantha TaxID=393608 RepID=A0A7C8ZA03_OPUST
MPLLSLGYWAVDLGIAQKGFLYRHQDTILLPLGAAQNLIPAPAVFSRVVLLILSMVMELLQVQPQLLLTATQHQVLHRLLPMTISCVPSASPIARTWLLVVGIRPAATVESFWMLVQFADVLSRLE